MIPISTYIKHNSGKLYKMACERYALRPDLQRINSTGGCPVCRGYVQDRLDPMVCDRCGIVIAKGVGAWAKSIVSLGNKME
jgi:hypothetical protein